MSEILVPILYIGNINYYSVILQNKEHVVYDINEHYIKQSYHNRAEIYGANGKLSLIVPLEKRNKRTILKEVKVAYDEPWQKVHWKSFESAYRSSPYFEFYEHEFVNFYKKGNNYEYLVDFNLALHNLILRLLKTSIDNNFTKEYVAKKGLDYRKRIHPKLTPVEPYQEKKYIQVFESKAGFIPNLSILDLLFNEGPNAIIFLI